MNKLMTNESLAKEGMKRLPPNRHPHQNCIAVFVGGKEPLRLDVTHLQNSPQLLTINDNRPEI